MAHRPYSLPVAVQILENGLALAEGLGIPEFVQLGEKPERLADKIGGATKRLLDGLPPLEMHRRLVSGPVSVDTLSITWEPRSHSPGWTEPLELRFPYARWRQGNRTLALVSALQLTITVKENETLESVLEQEIRFVLQRFGFASSVRRMVALQRCGELRVLETDLPLSLLSPKQWEQAQTPQAPTQSILSEVGIELKAQLLEPAFEVSEQLPRIARHFTGPRRRSVLLVGPSGVGKTAVFHELVRRSHEHGLARVPFWSTSGSRLVAGQSGAGQWQERLLKLCQEAQAKDAVVHLGSLTELMEVGRSERQEQGMAAFLRPYLARGVLAVVAECTPLALPVISRRDPHLLDQFEQIEIPPPSPQQCRAVLHAQTERWAPRYQSTLSPAALDTVERLHQRYATYSALPGRPLRFLESLLEQRRSSGPVEPGEVTAWFSRQTGLPEFLLDEQLPLELAEARKWFTDRLAGQDQAVDLVLALIATIKAYLARPAKPLASLLFIGPTGVGKTELAKLLAEFMFGDVARLTRFDMSEFADSTAVERLIGGQARGEGLLTAKVREQPFLVILLDELEKAHHRLFDLLLQVLGEGRLTDRAGRLADFTNAVVIMTSNLGAHLYQQATPGFVGSDPGHTEQARLLAEIREFFRPELVNRIDRIVPFNPLEPAALARIATYQLERLNHRDGVRQRPLTLTFDPRLAPHLAQEGYVPRYGARPLRRKIDREILARLATALAPIDIQTPLTATIGVNDGKIGVSLIRGEPHRSRSPLSTSVSLNRVQQVAELRRKAQQGMRSATVQTLDNDIFRARRRLKQIEKKGSRYQRQGEAVTLTAALERKSSIRSLLESNWQAICEAETAILKQFYGDLPPEPIDASQLISLTKALAHAWRSLVAGQQEDPNRIIVGLFAEEPAPLRTLARAYHRLIRTGQGKCAVRAWYWRKSEKTGTNELTPEPEPSADPLFDAGDSLLRGITLSVHQPMCVLTWSGEAGMHHFVEGASTRRVRVHCALPEEQSYAPPDDVLQRLAQKHQPLRRTYDLGHGQLEDKTLNKSRRFARTDFIPALSELIETATQERVEREILS